MNGVLANSKESFFQTAPVDGTLNVLLSGNFSRFSEPIENPNSVEYNYESGSWGYNESTGQFVEVQDDLSGEKIYIEGLTVSTTDSQGRSRATELMLCSRLQFTVKLGDYKQSHIFTVQNKIVWGNYIAIDTGREELNVTVPEGSTLPTIKGIRVLFKGTAKDATFPSLDQLDYEGYECEPNSAPLEITVEPVQFDAEFENFNPVLNNELESVSGTIAHRVETVNIDGNSKLQNTEMAQIPDYYFTSRALQVGKYLGTKISYITDYSDNKGSFVRNNINTVSGSVASVDMEDSSGIIDICGDKRTGKVLMTGRDRPFYTIQIFEGSIFAVGKDDKNNKSEVILNIKKMGNANIDIQQLGFIRRAVLVENKVNSSEYSYITTRPFESKDSTEITQDLEHIPSRYDIVVNQTSNTIYRVTQKYIYIKELGKVAETNEYGHIISIS